MVFERWRFAVSLRSIVMFHFHSSTQIDEKAASSIDFSIALRMSTEREGKIMTFRRNSITVFGSLSCPGNARRSINSTNQLSVTLSLSPSLSIFLVDKSIMLDFETSSFARWLRRSKREFSANQQRVERTTSHFHVYIERLIWCAERILPFYRHIIAIISSKSQDQVKQKRIKQIHIKSE